MQGKNQKSTNIGNAELVDDDTVSNTSNTWFRRILKQVFRKTKISETRKAIVLNDLIDSASPGMDFFFMILFSSAIATFGLISNSSVVTIGAQLIDPLMAPILGLSIASLSGLHRLFNRSILAITKGAGAAIALSAVISFVGFRIPNGVNAQIPHEIMVRTIATPIDLGIAIAGGAAAAYALAHPRHDATLAGVAIATALVPPLCTIGFGVAFMNPSIFLGATLQFLTNFVAIAFAAISVFAFMGFRTNKPKAENRTIRTIIISVLMMLVIAVPLVILAWNTLSAAKLKSRVSSVIVANLPDSAHSQLVDLTINSVGSVKEVTATLRMERDLLTAESEVLNAAVDDQFAGPIVLRIITMPMKVFD